MTDIPWYAVVFVAAMTLAFTWAGAYQVFRTRRLRRHGVRTTATVVELEERKDEEGALTYCPILEFTTTDGRPIRVSSGLRGKPAPAPLGRRLTIAYDQHRPDQTPLVERGAGLAWVTLVVGILLGGLLVVMLLASVSG